MPVDLRYLYIDNPETLELSDPANVAMEIYGKKILIVFGKIKYSFIQRNIVFLPIYLVINKKVTKQIGVVEFEKDEALELYDDEEDVIVEKDGDDYLVDSFFIDE